VTNEHTNGTGGGDDGITDKIDYPREFLRDTRVELEAICKRLGEIDDRLPFASIAERRSIMFRLAEYFEVLSTATSDAAGVIRDHTAALTLYLARR
jgi:hypothetical protein